MAGSIKKQNEPDRFERELFAALEPTEHDVSRAADSPFLLRRLMVSIAAEEKRREQMGVWPLGFGIVLRAIPTFAAVSLTLVCVFLFSSPRRTEDASSRERTVRAEENAALGGGLPMIMNEDLVSVMLGLRSSEPRGEQQ
jgi:hypothetical protein